MKKVISFITAITTAWLAISATVKNTVDEVYATTKVPQGYGDLNNDGAVDVFDSIYARRTATAVDSSIDKRLYTKELQGYLLGKSDTFTVENVVVDGNVKNQSVPADSPVFSEINTVDSPFKVGASVIASGWAEGLLSVAESSYSQMISNPSMLGTPIELAYSDGFTVESMVIKFQIDKKFVESPIGADEIETFLGIKRIDEFKGIKRLCIFKYYEDVNMLLPIKTEHDTANNLVYATVDGLGTYCVIDMEMWTAEINGVYTAQQEFNGIVPPNAVASANVLYDTQEFGSVTQDTVASASVNAVFDVSIPNGGKTVGMSIPGSAIEASTYPGQATFANGSTTINYTNFLGHKYAMFPASVLGKSPKWEDAHDYCKKMGGHLLTVTNGYEESFMKITLKPLSGITFYWVGATTSSTSWVTGESMDYVNNICYSLSGLRLSSVTPYIGSYLYYSVGYDYSSPFELAKCGFICEWESGKPILNPNTVATSSPLLLPTGHGSRYLDAKLNVYNKIDTDGDTLTDWEEIDTEFIESLFGSNFLDISGYIKESCLPTLQQCIAKKDKLGYDSQWLKEYGQAVAKCTVRTAVGSEEANNPLNAKVIPIKSDPTLQDTDGDGARDDVDKYPMKYNQKKNYIFYPANYGSDKYLYNEAEVRRKEYKSANRLVEMCPTSNEASFKFEWNHMGYENSGEKIEFVIDEVIIVGHGGPLSIGIGDSDSLYAVGSSTVFTVDKLDKKNIAYLNLSSCNSGNLDYNSDNGLPNYRDNLSRAFIKSKHEIGKVTGWDGYSSYNKWYLMFVGSFGSESSSRYLDEKKELSSFDNWSIDVNGFRREDMGMITYTKNKDGSVQFSPSAKIPWNG